MPLKSWKSVFIGMASNCSSCNIATQPPFACIDRYNVLSVLGCVCCVPGGEIAWLSLASASLHQLDAVLCLQIKNLMVVLRSLAMVRPRSGQDMFWKVSSGSKQLEMNEKLEDVSDYKDSAPIIKSLRYSQTAMQRISPGNTCSVSSWLDSSQHVYCPCAISSPWTFLYQHPNLSISTLTRRQGLPLL